MKWIVKEFDQLTLVELHDIVRLRTDVFVVEQRCVYPEIDGRDPACTLLLGNVDSALGAYARWYGAGSAVVAGRIVVRRDLRHRGRGRELMRKIFETVGNREIRISAQRHLEHYYVDLGFETTSEPHDDFGIQHIDMVRTSRAGESPDSTPGR